AEKTVTRRAPGAPMSILPGQSLFIVRGQQMSVVSRWCGAARLLALLCAVGAWSSVATARSVNTIDAADPGDRALIGSAPIAGLPDQALPAASDEPFRLAAVNIGPMAAKWRRLQPAIRLEGQILALCRQETT